MAGPLLEHLPFGGFNVHAYLKNGFVGVSERTSPSKTGTALTNWTMDREVIYIADGASDWGSVQAANLALP